MVEILKIHFAKWYKVKKISKLSKLNFPIYETIRQKLFQFTIFRILL